MSRLRDEIQRMVWDIEARIDGLAEPNLDDQRFLTLGQAMLEVLDTIENPTNVAAAPTKSPNISGTTLEPKE